jgi:urea transporter
MPPVMRIVSNMVVSFCYTLPLSIAVPAGSKKRKGFTSKGLKRIWETRALKNPFILKGWASVLIGCNNKKDFYHIDIKDIKEIQKSAFLSYMP